MKLLLLVALLACPTSSFAQDRWFAADKARHFGAGAAVAGGGYAIAVPLTRRTKWRLTLGTSAGVAAGAGKEIRDRRRGEGSWRDFAWTSGGTAAGVLIAWIVDKATN